MRGGHEARNNKHHYFTGVGYPGVSTEAMVRLPKQPEPHCTGFIIQQEFEHCMALSHCRVTWTEALVHRGKTSDNQTLGHTRFLKE